MIRDLIIKGLAISGLDLKTASEYLGVKQSQIKDVFKTFSKLSNLEKLELVFSEENENNRKFLKLCLYGKEKFVKHFLGIEPLDHKEALKLLSMVETDPALIARLSKAALDFEKLELQKSKEGASEVDEIFTKLSEIGRKLEWE